MSFDAYPLLKKCSIMIMNYSSVNTALLLGHSNLNAFKSIYSSWKIFKGIFLFCFGKLW